MTLEMLHVLRGIERCPHCGVASPEMTLIFQSKLFIRPEGAYGHRWAMYQCNSCYLVILAQSDVGNAQTITVKSLYPTFYTPDAELPERVRTYIKQAADSLHAPDGAAMLAGAAVDAMLKEKGYIGGSVYSRTDQAVQDGVLTKEMAEWAHDVRLGSNRPRHADENDPHVSLEEATQSVEFAKMLGHFLFVLPAKVSQKAKAAKISQS